MEISSVSFLGSDKMKLPKLKPHSLNVLLAVFATCLFFFGIWQHDMICVDKIWRPGVADGYFQCWIWKTTLGEGYDVTLFLIFLGYWLMFAALWFWNDEAKREESVVTI